MFKTIKLEGNWWGVFLVNPSDEKDRYLVTGTFDKQRDADHFRDEFSRLVSLGE